MSISLLVLLCIIAVASGALLFRRKASPTSSQGEAVPNPIDPASLFISSASESAARASRVLPDGPGENATHVLGSPPAAPRSHARDNSDFLPNPRAEWIIHVAFRDDATVTLDKLLAVLNQEWLTANDSPTLFGFSPETGHWTYLLAADVPDRYSELQVAWRYLPLDPGLTVTFETTERWLRELIAAVSRIGPASVKPGELPSAAERHASELQALRNDLQDAGIVIGLVADKDHPFEGRALWDAFSSLGLEWGDGDLFHWVNPNQDTGDDSLFDVSTSTPPGYFLPEQAAEGRLRVEDLTFSLSIPRTHEPAMVLDAMIRAARYAQKRLGGTLVALPGNEPLDDAVLRRSLEKVVERMNAAGIRPGSEEALQLF